MHFFDATKQRKKRIEVNWDKHYSTALSYVNDPTGAKLPAYFRSIMPKAISEKLHYMYDPFMLLDLQNSNQFTQEDHEIKKKKLVISSEEKIAYAAYYATVMELIDYSKATGNFLGWSNLSAAISALCRFVCGHWNNHHGKEVAREIAPLLSDSKYGNSSKVEDNPALQEFLTSLNPRKNGSVDLILGKLNDATELVVSLNVP